MYIMYGVYIYNVIRCVSVYNISCIYDMHVPSKHFITLILYIYAYTLILYYMLYAYVLYTCILYSPYVLYTLYTIYIHTHIHILYIANLSRGGRGAPGPYPRDA